MQKNGRDSIALKSSQMEVIPQVTKRLQRRNEIIDKINAQKAVLNQFKKSDTLLLSNSETIDTLKKHGIQK